jgi:hypothetical protein
MAAFVADADPKAFEKAVDRLLLGGKCHALGICPGVIGGDD